MPAGTIYVGRPSRWGNPIRCSPTADGRAEAVAEYRRWLGSRPDVRAMVRAELVGCDLACWCPLTEPCHADVLLEVANGGENQSGDGRLEATEAFE